MTDVNATATGTDSSGIIIDHSGTVELNRVNASHNGYHGALIYNDGSVKITNSSFDHNLQNVDDGINYYDDQYDEYGTIWVLVLHMTAWRYIQQGLLPCMGYLLRRI